MIPAAIVAIVVIIGMIGGLCYTITSLGLWKKRALKAEAELGKIVLTQEIKRHYSSK